MADEKPVAVEDLKDLEWDLMCQIQHVVAIATLFGRVTKVATRPCTRPADWIATCRACGNPGYLCDIDRRSTPKLICGKCDATGDVMFDFTRIPPAGDR